MKLAQKTLILNESENKDDIIGASQIGWCKKTRNEGESKLWCSGHLLKSQEKYCKKERSGDRVLIEKRKFD